MDIKRPFPWGIVLIGATVVIIAILLGCQTTKPTVVTQVVERQVEVPKSLQTCSREPVAGTVWINQKDVARYMVKLAEAGEDCRTKLTAVARLVDQTN